MSAPAKTAGTGRDAMHPCFSDASDYRPQGKPETVVELDGGADVAIGLLVLNPFGPNTDAVLTIHANTTTGTHGIAIADALSFDHQPAPKKAMDMHLLRGPVREDGDDGSDDGA